jgi:NAD(P)-dependent dehydrogenase (short-subunit alcohol dehydrogenase family)
MADLTGSAAIMIGTSAAIGRVTARRLAHKEGDVAVAARRMDRLDTLRAVRTGPRRETLVVPTVGDDELVAALADRTVDALGGLDIVVNNAAVGSYGNPIDDVTTKQFQ